MGNFTFYESRFFTMMLHICAIVQMGYALHYDLNLNVPNTPGMPQMLRGGFGGRSRFLTYWCLILQAVYFGIAVLNDMFGSNEVAPTKKPFIRKVKDYFFATFAFPIAFIVGVVFWSLYAYNRELIFPKVIEAFFPKWLNHIMHSNIMVFMLLELFTSYRNYPSKKWGLTGLSLFIVAYLGWIHVIKHHADIWVYPILEVLSLPARIGFFVACIVFSIFVYHVGEFANRQIWIKENKEIEKLRSAKAK